MAYTPECGDIVHLQFDPSSGHEMKGAGTDTQGAIHCHQLKSLDWAARKAKFKEKVPSVILDDAQARLSAILFAETR